jgi:glycosyltransferase involved in cell wall biosynthesis
MKTAIVHDHFCQAGGAERVVEVLHRMFPEAPIYTTILCRDRLWPGLRDAQFHTSWMQALPAPRRTHRLWFPFYPNAIERFDLRAYDLVISSSSAFARGAIVRPGARHVCYCHTPMRYVWNWDGYVERERFGPVARRLLPPLIRRLRDWDLRTRDRPSLYIANSTAVAGRIRRSYDRDAVVIHPPVGVHRYDLAEETGDFHLIVSRLVAYKRVDLAVAAFNAMRRPLVIVGDGPARPALERIAGDTIRFTGRLPDEQVARLYARCRALIFPGEEDFGIAPVEANAAGRPVIAYRAGGALDTVVDGETGVFFDRQDAASLMIAVRRCDTVAWNGVQLRAHAMRFSETVFEEKMRAAIDAAPPVAIGRDAPATAGTFSGPLRSPADGRARRQAVQPSR